MPRLSWVRTSHPRYIFHKDSCIPFTGEEVVGVNPKVNNLIKSYRQATHDILWVVDSNISVAPGTLARAVDLLTEASRNPSKKRAALVHHVPFATEYEGYLGAQVEAAFLNTNHAKMYLAINTVAIESCVVGKSNLYRRSDLERINGSLKLRKETDPRKGEYGLAAFGSFLAEDNMIASALWHELDVRHDLSCDVAHNAIGKMTLADYVWRRVRWIRVRKHMVLAATLLEPFTENLVASSIAAASVKYLFGVSPWIFLPIHHSVWLWVDLDVYESLAGYPLPAHERWKFIAAWCIREVLALPIWMLAVCGDEVTWRGKQYQVLRAGQVRRRAPDGARKGFWRRWWGQEGDSSSEYESLLVNEAI
jgi:ceramide glucosyltransferase